MAKTPIAKLKAALKPKVASTVGAVRPEVMRGVHRVIREFVFCLLLVGGVVWAVHGGPHYLIVLYITIMISLGLFMTLGADRVQKATISAVMIAFILLTLASLTWPSLEFNQIGIVEPIGYWIAYKYLFAFALAWFGALLFEPLVKRYKLQNGALILGLLFLSWPLWLAYHEHKESIAPVQCQSLKEHLCKRVVEVECLNENDPKEICQPVYKPWYSPENGQEDFALTMMAVLVIAAVKLADE